MDKHQFSSQLYDLIEDAIAENNLDKAFVIEELNYVKKLVEDDELVSTGHDFIGE